MSSVTNDHQTSLLAQAQCIADDFTFGSEEAQRVTGHFVRQMSATYLPPCHCEGLLTIYQEMAS
jgi:hypothetical protein